MKLIDILARLNLWKRGELQKLIATGAVSINGVKIGQDDEIDDNSISHISVGKSFEMSITRVPDEIEYYSEPKNP